MREHVALVIVGRLNTGWVMINAEPDPATRTRLEDHWIALLRQYEAMCDQEALDRHQEAA